MSIQRLSGEESQALYSLLRAEQRPFHEILSQFNSSIPSSRHFTLSSYLLILLQDNKVLTTTERLIAFSLLVEAYSSQKPASNPFISFVVNASCHEGSEKVERAFILQLLGVDSSNSGKEFLKQSASDYVKGFDQSLHEFPPLDQHFHNHNTPSPLLPLTLCSPFPVSPPPLPSLCQPRSPHLPLILVLNGGTASYFTLHITTDDDGELHGCSFYGQ